MWLRFALINKCALFQVLSAPTVGNCISSCLESREIFDFYCRSVIYYPSTQDCLLNSLDTRTSANKLTRDTDDFQVDYYENHVVTGTLLALVRYMKTRR